MAKLFSTDPINMGCQIAEPMTGFEPVTSSLPRKHSTPELHRLINLKQRAGDEARTRDLQLGRLSLYQLSYSRLFDH